MNIKDIPIPEIYESSADFRFFCDWFATSLEKTKYDIENFFDLYDPLRVPENLIWMLADTMGFKYDNRLPVAFNRLVLLYFMSMIRNRGSKDGVTLAAETNLGQFNILLRAQENEILYNRLEDTSIPVNSVYVTPHTSQGYIDVVYFSTEIPLDACIEYVRPLGMYLFQHAGVRFDARTKISVDARLTDERDVGMSFGPTHIGHYSRDDYARMQKMFNTMQTPQLNNIADTRRPVWNRNVDYEVDPDLQINPGYRALYSLQLSNNEQIMKALIDPIFSLGYGPQDVDVMYSDDYLYPPYSDKPVWNLRYDRMLEESITPDVFTVDDDRTDSIIKPRPAVNPIMSQVGDAISMAGDNSKYTKNEGGTIIIKDSTDV